MIYWAKLLQGALNPPEEKRTIYKGRRYTIDSYRDIIKTFENLTEAELEDISIFGEIDRDVSRTFRLNDLFQSGSDCEFMLKRALRCFAKEFPDVKWDKELVDAATARMVNRPATLDTLVATNLHADILSDLAAALAGSLGIAPTGNIDPERRYPSMFEPIHGSAFDIMGKGLANPIGTFWSVVMLLEHLGEQAAADRLMHAIEAVTANPRLHTRDLGGLATTAQVTAAVCDQLK